MKHLITVVFTALSLVAFGQQKVYQVRIIKYDGSVHKGYMRSVTENAILFTSSPTVTEPIIRIDYGEIQTIKIRRKSSPLAGFILGAAGGALLGVVIGGLGYPDDCEFFCEIDRDVSMATGAVVGAVSGGLLGIAIGGSSKKIHISSNGTAFDLARPTLANYVLH